MSISPRFLLGRRRRDVREFGPCEYLTDGRRLLRVVTRFDPRVERVCAVLEDCHTLALDAYTPDELARMALRPVPLGYGRDAEPASMAR